MPPGRLHIGLGHGADPGDLPEKGQADFLGFFGGFRLRHLGPQNHGDLLVQIIHHIFDEHGKVVPGVIDAVGFVPGRAGVDDTHQLSDHINDNGLVRMLEQVHLVDVPSVAVILQNAVNNAFDLQFNGGHGKFLLTGWTLVYHRWKRMSIDTRRRGVYNSKYLDDLREV